MDARASIVRIKETGKPVIGCFPLYPPLELFHSLGLAPVVLWGLRDSVATLGAADRHVQGYACSVARHMTQFLIDETDLFDGIFFYNACDTLRNLPEILRESFMEAGSSALPMFRMHLPMMPASQMDSSEYLAGEIGRLIESLESEFGVAFSESRFEQSVELYARMRALCAELESTVARGLMSFGRFSGLLTRANFLDIEDQIALLESASSSFSPDAQEVERKVESVRPLSVVVSGILPPSSAVCGMMEDAGLLVVGNDIASMKRSYARGPQNWQDVADYYNQFYGEHFPCTTLLYTADKRPETLEALAAASEAHGFVFIGEKFCEYEYLELPYITERLKEAGIHVLAIEVSAEDAAGSEMSRTRIEAFAELVSASTHGT